MVNGKKVIAVCVSKSNNEENLVFLKELHAQAKQKNYIVVVYYLVSDVFIYEENSAPEPDDLKMINYDFVDALIVFHDHLMTDEIINELVRVAKENNKPRIVVGAGCDNAFSIEYQGDDCFEAIVRHVVEEHGFRNVYFMAGVPELEFSTLWVDIYRKVLEENGISFDDSKVGFGYYWSSPTYEIIEKWLAEDKIPDAIICANDIMAITACKCLSEHGYKVPGDVIVTGFDGIVREKYHYPRITNGAKDEAVTCNMIIEVLDGAFGGSGFELKQVKQPYKLNLTQSCGCGDTEVNDVNNMVNVLYNRLSEFDSHETYVYKMAGQLSGISDKKMMGGVLARHIMGNAYIAIRDCIWNDDNQDNPGTVDFDETVTVVRRKKDVLTEQKNLFPLGTFLPDMFSLDSQENLLGVFPLRYLNQLYGYYVVHLDGTIENAYCHGRFVNMANISINMVFNHHKLVVTNERMADMQTRDPLTGLYNRHGFIQTVSDKYLANPNNRCMIIAALDIDRLKNINEEFGHNEGDAALIALAEMIKSNSSVEDVCARYGTNEFLCAIFTNEDCEYITYNLFNSIFSSVKNHNRLYDKEYTLTVNYDYIFGKPADVEEVNKLVKTVLEKKKHKSDSRKALDKNVVDKEGDVRDYKDFCKVLDENLFRYMFQPIIDVKSGEIYGYEALMRSGGDIQLSPLRMINLATKYDRLMDVERHTFNNVLKQVNENKEKFKGRKVFVNSIISSVLPVSETRELIDRYKDIIGGVVVEVTEQTQVSSEEFTGIVNFLNDKGLEVALDDYGAGYSNTSRLIDCNPAYIKIDRSLITGIHRDYKKQHFVSDMIEYAHDNGFKVLAEGVENASELKAVIRMGVDLIQGYYTARPAYEIVDEVSSKISKDVLRYAERQGDD